jgi:type II secretory pathway component PulM
MVTEEPIKQPLKKRRHKYRYKKVRRHRRSWAGLSKWQRGILATLGAIVLLIVLWLVVQAIVYLIIHAGGME